MGWRFLSWTWPNLIYDGSSAGLGWDRSSPVYFAFGLLSCFTLLGLSSLCNNIPQIYNFFFNQVEINGAGEPGPTNEIVPKSWLFFSLVWDPFRLVKKDFGNNRAGWGFKSREFFFAYEKRKNSMIFMMLNELIESTGHKIENFKISCHNFGRDTFPCIKWRPTSHGLDKLYDKGCGRKI